MTVNKIRRNGSYAPLSAHYYKDDAIDEAGEAAELLYVRGLAFCADVLNDGFISERQLVRFVGVGMFDATERAEKLVAVGLWERAVGGYHVRSWLNWNRSRADITAAQAKDSARKTTGSKPSDDTDPEPPSGGGQHADGIPNGFRADSELTSDGSPGGVQPHAGARARSPRNSTPLQEELSVTADAVTAEAVLDAEFETWWKPWPRKVAKQAALRAYRAARRKKVPAELLLTAAAAHAAVWKSERRTSSKIPHGATWLNDARWNDELERPRFTVINNPESPWDGVGVSTTDSIWGDDMGRTS